MEQRTKTVATALTSAVVGAVLMAVVPSPLEVASWANYLGFHVIPPNVRLDTWKATPPTTGAPVVDTVWEAKWIRTSGDLWTVPVALEDGDSVTFFIRCAARDSLLRQGPWSEWGVF